MNPAQATMSPFAIHIADIRRRHGLTQDDMAKALGVAAAYLSAVEHGVKPISDGLLGRLEQVYANNAREKARLLSAANASMINRRMPTSAHTKAYFYVEDLWSCMGALEEEDWLALHTVLHVIAGNRIDQAAD